VTAVRRLWGRAWEVYRVERGGGDAGEGATAVERTTLAQQCEQKPRSADMLAAYARRRRKRGGARPEVPGRPDTAWAAEDGWL
jgi:hypothetical protein